jgi:tRNA (guanine37-N1)-methyltransferase
MTFRATVFTLFPEAFPGVLGLSLAGRGLAEGVWSLESVDIRGFATDRHRSVDDTPAGGGPGMILRADVLAAAIDATLPPDDPRPRLVMTPRGTPIRQDRICALAAGPGVVLLAGRFEGIDQRLIDARGFQEISVADVVLSGGELAAMVVLDACVRLLPGIMGDVASGVSESFEEDLLEHPQFTKPASFEGRDIPEVLLSGDHGRIAAWRRAEAQKVTRARRPDLWARHIARLRDR